MPSAASPSRIDSLRATLRIAQLDSRDDTNPTWDDFDQALATVDALATAFRDLVEAARRVPRATIGQKHRYLDPLVSDRLWAALDASEEARE